MAKATTVRFTDEVYERLDQASARTGMPVNSIVVAACLEWMQRHTPEQEWQPAGPISFALPTAPRWSTIRRAIRLAGRSPGAYPFERFSERAKKLLTFSQAEAQKAGSNHIGTEHLLLACFADEEFQSSRILKALGVEAAAVRSNVEQTIKAEKSRSSARFVPTSRVKRVIQMAFNECATRGHPRVGTGHVLLALAEEGDGIAAHVLAGLGATPQRIDEELRKLSDFEA